MAKTKKPRKQQQEPPHNPFEPSGSGAPLQEAGFWLPQEWESELASYLDGLDSGTGRRAVAIVGEYGSGKSYVLRWLERKALPARGILAYYFENPEVKFYDLANSLLRRIGRKHFAKVLYELAAPHLVHHHQTLFSTGFDAFLERYRTKVPLHILDDLRSAILKAEISNDEQIVDCLARIVAETGKKPYFEYRDFVTSKTGSYVAEKQEPKYFNSVLEILRRGDGVERIAFLVDEFEEISLQRHLTRRDAQDYLVTLKRLVDVSAEGDFWLFLAMTPDAWETTTTLDPAFESRCYRFTVRPLTKENANQIVRKRLKEAQHSFPFPAKYLDSLQPATYSNPRRLIKVFHVAMNDVLSGKAVSGERLTGIESQLYPADGEGEGLS